MIGSNYDKNEGKLTVDGEHPNNEGAEIIAKSFAKMMKRYVD